jgi:hypothetical protein
MDFTEVTALNQGFGLPVGLVICRRSDLNSCIRWTGGDISYSGA